MSNLKTVSDLKVGDVIYQTPHPEGWGFLAELI